MRPPFLLSIICLLCARCQYIIQGAYKEAHAPCKEKPGVEYTHSTYTHNTHIKGRGEGPLLPFPRFNLRFAPLNFAFFAARIVCVSGSIQQRLYMFDREFTIHPPFFCGKIAKKMGGQKYKMQKLLGASSTIMGGQQYIM